MDTFSSGELLISTKSTEQTYLNTHQSVYLYATPYLRNMVRNDVSDLNHHHGNSSGAIPRGVKHRIPVEGDGARADAETITQYKHTT